jgi:AraC-like DNA-binding protein
LKRWKREGLFPITPRQPVGDVDFGPRFDELLRQSRRTDRTGVRRAIHLLEGILIELAEAPGPTARHVPWLDAMIDRLTAPGAELPDYAAMADQAGISESTLRRAFRKVMGTSPHAYRLQALTAEARRLLAETRLPIKSIAMQLGYRDVYFFSRQFKQITGVPPATYRRSAEG